MKNFWFFNRKFLAGLSKLQSTYPWEHSEREDLFFNKMIISDELWLLSEKFHYFVEKSSAALWELHFTCLLEPCEEEIPSGKNYSFLFFFGPWAKVFLLFINFLHGDIKTALYVPRSFFWVKIVSRKNFFLFIVLDIEWKIFRLLDSTCPQPHSYWKEVFLKKWSFLINFGKWATKYWLFLWNFSTRLSKRHTTCPKGHFEWNYFFWKNQIVHHFRTMSASFRPSGKTFSIGISKLQSTCPEEHSEEEALFLIKKLFFDQLRLFSNRFRLFVGIFSAGLT